MKRFLAVIEDINGNVIGANTDAGDVMLAEEEIVPRSQLREAAITLATKYALDPASFTLPAPTPARVETDSTPEGAD